MTNPYYRDGKSFIPFRRPLPWAVSYGSIDGPLVCVRFSYEWRSIILGALGVLARPETYFTEVPGEEEYLADEGAQLLAQFAAASQFGCDVEPEGTWECSYDFSLSDGDWEMVQFNGYDAGEWVNGVGWQSQVAFDGTRELWTRVLSLRKTFEPFISLTSLSFDYRHIFEQVAPQYYGDRSLLLGASRFAYIYHQLYLHNASDQLNGHALAANPHNIYVDKVFFVGFAGASETASDLEFSDVTLYGAQLYGGGDSPDC